MPDSGLFRNQDAEAVRRQHLANPPCLQQAKTVVWGGGALAYMAVSDRAGRASGVYWSDESLRGCEAAYGDEFQPSPLADAVLDDGRRRELWELSAFLSNLQPAEDLTHRS
jgi:hypothetical protein